MNTETLKKKLKQNSCINGKNPDNMNHKQYLKEFAKGPCSPVMLIPGLLATKLMVKLNCEILMKYNNETFKKCGWNSCSKGFWEVKLI